MLGVRHPSEDSNLWQWANDIGILSYLGSRGVLRCVHAVSFWMIIFVYHKRGYEKS